MTKLRTTLSLIACTSALALSTAATSAKSRGEWIELVSVQIGPATPLFDLPTAPPVPPTAQMDRHKRIHGSAGPKLPNDPGAPKLTNVPKAPRPSLSAYFSKVHGEKQ
jgi:hypothetical protein